MHELNDVREIYLANCHVFGDKEKDFDVPFDILLDVLVLRFFFTLEVFTLLVRHAVLAPNNALHVHFCDF